MSTKSDSKGAPVAGSPFGRNSQTRPLITLDVTSVLASPPASLTRHGFASEAYLKCDWCGAPASFWARQKNYCGDCLAARMPENKPAKDWWPAVQQVAAAVVLTAKVREAAPARARSCAEGSSEMQMERMVVLEVSGSRVSASFPSISLKH